MSDAKAACHCGLIYALPDWEGVGGKRVGEAHQTSHISCHFFSLHAPRLALVLSGEGDRQGGVGVWATIPFDDITTTEGPSLERDRDIDDCRGGGGGWV